MFAILGCVHCMSTNQSRFPRPTPKIGEHGIGGDAKSFLWGYSPSSGNGSTLAERSNAET